MNVGDVRECTRGAGLYLLLELEPDFPETWRCVVLEPEDEAERTAEVSSISTFWLKKYTQRIR